MGGYTIHRLQAEKMQRGYPNDPVLVFVGRRKSGKTTGIFGLMHAFRHDYQQVIVICGSLDTAQEYAQHVPDCFIWQNFDEERLTAIYNENESFVYRRARGGSHAAKEKPVETMIIIDDCMYMNRILNRSEILQKMMYNGRHAGILLVISLQDCKGLPPYFRNQCSHVFLTREKSRPARERLYDTFNNVFHNFDQFNRIMKDCTADYRMMVLDMESQKSDKIQDNVYWYRAEPGLKFKMDRNGPMWRFHAMHYDKNYFKRPSGSTSAVAETTKKPAARTRKTAAAKKKPVAITF
jgi:hypothetical protein